MEKKIDKNIIITLRETKAAYQAYGRNKKRVWASATNMKDEAWEKVRDAYMAAREAYQDAYRKEECWDKDKAAWLAAGKNREDYDKAWAAREAKEKKR